jgi:hypothetical protein
MMAMGLVHFEEKYFFIKSLLFEDGMNSFTRRRKAGGNSIQNLAKLV